MNWSNSAFGGDMSEADKQETRAIEAHQRTITQRFIYMLADFLIKDARHEASAERKRKK